MTEDLRRILEKNGLPFGRLIASSKTEYLRTHPFNNVFFNACVFELDEGREVWYGDVDLNDEDTLRRFIKSVLEYKKPFLLTRETPYRFVDRLKIGNIVDASGLNFIKTKYGWIGGGGKIDLDKLSDEELEELYSNIDLAVVTEEGIAKSSDKFDKVLFAPENTLTEEDEYGRIDYIKSGIKILSKFI